MRGSRRWIEGVVAEHLDPVASASAEDSVPTEVEGDLVPATEDGALPATGGSSGLAWGLGLLVTLTGLRQLRRRPHAG